MTDFEMIYRKYFQYVYYYMLGICKNREIAEEVTQETFFAALTTKAKFQEKSDVRTWLCHIAKNKYIDMLRKQKKIENDVDLESIEDQADFLGQMAQKETAMRVHKYLHTFEATEIDEVYYMDHVGLDWYKLKKDWKDNNLQDQDVIDLIEKHGHLVWEAEEND